MKINNANKKRPRDLHFAQGPFFFCAHTIGCDVGSRGVGMSLVPVTCYVLGKLRVRSVGLGETGDRM